MTAPLHDRLPIEGTPACTEHGWSIRLPVRAEEITITKQTVVQERIVLNRKGVQDVARVDAVLRREQLQVTRSGSVDMHAEVTEKLPGT